MNWLLASLVLSILLTVVLNAGLRLFPSASERAARRMDDLMTPRSYDDRPRVRVFFPWRTMLIVSIVLTVVLNAGRCVR